MIYDLDEFAADELEAEAFGQREKNKKNKRGSNPRQAVPPPGDGIIPNEAYNDYEDVYESVAEYTMIPDPQEDSIAGMSES